MDETEKQTEFPNVQRIALRIQVPYVEDTPLSTPRSEWKRWRYITVEAARKARLPAGPFPVVALVTNIQNRLQDRLTEHMVAMPLLARGDGHGQVQIEMQRPPVDTALL